MSFICGFTFNDRNLAHKMCDAMKHRGSTPVIREYDGLTVCHTDGVCECGSAFLEAGKLKLIRDLIGIEPLHYTCTTDGKTLFASEIKALFQYEELKREVNPQALHYFLNLRYVPGDHTMFANIYRVRPAHGMVNGEQHPYWQLPRPDEEYQGDSCPAGLRLMLDRIIQGDKGDIAVQISGGMDSSALVALLSQFYQNIKTFTMGFDNATDELDDARFVAEEFGTDHHEFVLDHGLLQDYPVMTWYADEPKRNLFPYYLAQYICNNGVTQVYDGSGGDELFGGYVFKYAFVKRIEEMRTRVLRERGDRTSQMATKLAAFQSHSGALEDDAHLDYLDTLTNLYSNVKLYMVVQTLDHVFFNPAYLERLYGSQMLRSVLHPVWSEHSRFFDNDRPFIEQVMEADFSEKMVNDFLLVGDRMYAANGVSVRMPFLDTPVVAFMFKIPTAYKLQDPNGKYVLKQAMADKLPPRILKKEKHGFASSTYGTYLSELRELARMYLPDGCAVRDGWLNREYIAKVLSSLPNPRLDLHYNVLWNMFAFEVWYRLFIEGDGTKPNGDIYGGGLL